MSPKKSTSKFQSEDFRFSGEFSTAVLELPADHITYACSWFEGFDNHALVRTREAGKGELYVYFATEQTDFIRQVVLDLNRHFPIRITTLVAGMDINEEIWTS